MTITSNFLSATTNTLRDMVPTYCSEHMPYFCLIYPLQPHWPFGYFLNILTMFQLQELGIFCSISLQNVLSADVPLACSQTSFSLCSLVTLQGGSPALPETADSPRFLYLSYPTLFFSLQHISLPDMNGMEFIYCLSTSLEIGLMRSPTLFLWFSATCLMPNIQ